MKHGRLLAAACAIFALVACGGARKDQKDAENMEKEGNAKIWAVTMTNIKLSNMGVEMEYDRPAGVSWKNKTVAERTEIKSMLIQTKSDSGRVLEIARHKNMRMSGGTARYENTIKNADVYLKDLADCEASPKTCAPKAG